MSPIQYSVDTNNHHGSGLTTQEKFVRNGDYHSNTYYDCLCMRCWRKAVLLCDGYYYIRIWYH
jgi:hypothetical protein